MSDRRCEITAVLSSDVNVKLGDPLRFDKYLINEGGCFNLLEGKFTAPINGNYVFSINIAAQRDRKAYLDVLHVKTNGEKSLIITLSSANSDTFFPTPSKAFPLQLNRNESIILRAGGDQTSPFTGNNQTSFTGLLIPAQD